MEGWRKIPPLMEILKENCQLDLSKIELKMTTEPPIITKDNFQSARDPPNKVYDYTKLNCRSIRDSWIFKHFDNPATKNTKIALYVNSIIPINQNMEKCTIDSVPNHCVVVKGLAKFPKGSKNGIDCLELENNGGCEETRYIPVDHPFFEEVQIRVNKIENEKLSNPDGRKTALNNYGKELAEMKWKNVEGAKGKPWYDRRKEVKAEGQKKSDKEPPYKYEMLFVRAAHQCFHLRFST